MARGRTKLGSCMRPRGTSVAWPSCWLTTKKTSSCCDASKRRSRGARKAASSSCTTYSLSVVIAVMDAKLQTAIEIVRRLRAKGFQAYLVGGCVRDLVMGRAPKDYDVSTAATPPQVVGLFPQSLTVGAQFGVVIVPREEGNVEVATFRSDGRYSDGRHPGEVRYTKTPQEDVRRRDFTLNGLLYDPIKKQVLDYVGGQADIRARR